MRVVLARSPLEQLPSAHLAGLLGMLVQDGSEASVDALLPIVTKAMAEKGEVLDVFRHALEQRTTGLERLHELLEETASNREGPAQRARMATAIQLSTLDQKDSWFSTFESGSGARLWFDVDFDADPWFWVMVTHNAKRSRFSSKGPLDNDLQLPPLGHAADFPSWVQALSALGPWDAPVVKRSTLRGAARKQLLEWLTIS